MIQKHKISRIGTVNDGVYVADGWNPCKKDDPKLQECLKVSVEKFAPQLGKGNLPLTLLQYLIGSTERFEIETTSDGNDFVGLKAYIT